MVLAAQPGESGSQRRVRGGVRGPAHPGPPRIGRGCLDVILPAGPHATLGCEPLVAEGRRKQVGALAGAPVMNGCFCSLVRLRDWDTSVLGLTSRRMASLLRSSERYILHFTRVA